MPEPLMKKADLELLGAVRQALHDAEAANEKPVPANGNSESVTHLLWSAYLLDTLLRRLAW